MTDLAFIRFKNTFEEAVNLNDSGAARIGKFDQIRLSPLESYTQISNSKTDIAFNGNFKVFVIDCLQKELYEITDKTTITQFTDNNGISQIVFKLSSINKDFGYKTVFIKIKHTVSDTNYYSNPIKITDIGKNLSTRFEYRHYTELNGIAYNIANVYQSIRLGCYFTTNDIESSSNTYTTIEGIKENSTAVLTEFEKYIFEKLDNFTYRRLNHLLIHSIIYANDYRVTDKITFESTDLKGSTNTFTVNFKLAINYKENINDLNIEYVPPTLTLASVSTITPYALQYSYVFSSNFAFSSLSYQYKQNLTDEWSSFLPFNGLTSPQTGEVRDLTNFYTRISAIDSVTGNQVFSNELNVTFNFTSNIVIQGSVKMISTPYNAANIILLSNSNIVASQNILYGGLTLGINEVVEKIGFLINNQNIGIIINRVSETDNQNTLRYVTYTHQEVLGINEINYHLNGINNSITQTQGNQGSYPITVYLKIINTVTGQVKYSNLYTIVLAVTYT